MKLIIPKNIYSTLFALTIPEKIRPELEVQDASLVIKSLLNESGNVGIIPSCDLINNKELFVSGKFGIGFEGLLSNSYLYFSKVDDNFSKIYLRGDITTNEAVLTKIVYKEIYNVESEIVLDTSEDIDENKNYLIVGNENWENNIFEKGISFSEQVSELINYPYMNFVFASASEDSIKSFNSNLNEVNKILIKNLENNLSKINLDENLNLFISENIESIYFDLEEYENEGLEELFKLAYYHQIIDNIIDIKFIK